MNKTFIVEILKRTHYTKQIHSKSYLKSYTVNDLHIVSNITEAKIFKKDLLQEIKKRFGYKNVKIHYLKK